MITWNNLDTAAAYQELLKMAPVKLAEAMTGESGADRVKKYSVPMAAGLSYNYAAKQVDDEVLKALEKLAEETQLADKFEALYNGEVINTGEKRMVLHHMTRGQLGEAVVADGVDKRSFYLEQQKKLRSWQIRCTAVKLPMRQGRSLPLSYRSASAAAISGPVQCTWLWKTGQK